MTTFEKLVVKFRAKTPPYNVGEIAGFGVEHSLELMRRGRAVPLDGDWRGVEPPEGAEVPDVAALHYTTPPEEAALAGEGPEAETSSAPAPEPEAAAADVSANLQADPLHTVATAREWAANDETTHAELTAAYDREGSQETPRIGVLDALDAGIERTAAITEAVASD